mmetsp:Transcript_40815/g.80089  ORF Transcript_40815/g.80089 Transcript_40815/m.80089 type:complete len:327 (-) Transcript_40815:180-1160(-)
MPQHVPPLTEFQKQFASEFDYREEALLLEEVASNLSPTWDKQVVVPKPVSKLCTKQVLVMQKLNGVKLIDGIINQFKRLASAEGKSFEQFQEEQKGKSMPSERYLRFVSVLLKMKDAALNTLRFLSNNTIGLVTGQRIEYHHSEIPLNIPALLRLLTDVHAHEVFVDGVFNADPHPGNVLLLEDGRLGLVDYGQVGRLNVRDRVVFSKLIVALAEDNREEVVDLFIAMGHRTKRMDRDILYRMAAFNLDRDSEDVTGEMNPMQFMDWLNNADPVVDMPNNWVMVGRLSVVLRGFANAFGIRPSMAKDWKPWALRCLEQQGSAAFDV